MAPEISLGIRSEIKLRSCAGIPPVVLIFQMNENLKQKLAALPAKPGCYIMRDRRGAIIYIGKAVSLRKRVGSYFRAGTLRSASPKLRGLVDSVADIEVVVVSNEAEAVLTEGRLIKAYKPRYNVFFKDDKRFPMLKTDVNKPFPRLELCRIRKNDGACYFGPYASSASARTALDFVEKRFGIRRCRAITPSNEDHKHCINDIVRFCAAPCIGKVTAAEYRERVDEACAFLRGELRDVLKELEVEMEHVCSKLNFEKAATLRDMLRALRSAVKQRARVARGPAADREHARNGVRGLAAILGLSSEPRLIEAFDVSCISGTHAVAGMVAAEDGIPRPGRYRRFRIKTEHAVDDSRMMAEAIRRRFSRIKREGGELPGLVLVDGGVIQLRAAKAELVNLGMEQVPVAGLAKRFEEIYWEGRADRDSSARANPRAGIQVIRLPSGAPALQVLKRLRDEAHRFALDYHRRLRGKRIRESALDEVPGLGEKGKMLLLKHFGSVFRLAGAETLAIASVPGVGLKTAQAVKDTLNGVSP